MFLLLKYLHYRMSDLREECPIYVKNVRSTWKMSDLCEECPIYVKNVRSMWRMSDLREECPIYVKNVRSTWRMSDLPKEADKTIVCVSVYKFHITTDLFDVLTFHWHLWIVLKYIFYSSHNPRPTEYFSICVIFCKLIYRPKIYLKTEN